MINKKDLNKYKFIISTGCSYGVVHESFHFYGHPKLMHRDIDDRIWPDKLILEDDIVSISLGVSSQGAKWQSDSIIYATNRLLQLGVKSENIYCFVEWSEWERGTTIIPKSMLGRENRLQNLKINKFHAEQNIRILDKSKEHLIERDSDDSHHRNIIHYIIDNIDIGRVDCNMTIGTIGETMYVTTSQIPWHIKDWKLKSKDGLVDFDKEEELQITLELQNCFKEMYRKENEMYLEELLDNYVNYIYQTELYFKQNNIEYNFTSINTQLCGWYSDEGFGTFNWERNNNIIEEMGDDGFVKLKDNPSKCISEENDIENVVESVSWKFNQIDLSKFNFHNCSRWRRGGIDNYLLDKFDVAVYNRPWALGHIEDSDEWNDLKIDSYNSLFSNPNNLSNDELRCRDKHQVPAIVLGNHPNEFLYCFVWNRFAKDCKFLQFSESFLEEMERMYWEDYNSDKVSVNGITLGKGWMNRWKEFRDDNL